MARTATATTDATFEGAAIEAFPWLLDALGVSAVGLLVPTTLGLGVRFGGHLVLLVALGIVVAYRLLPYTDGEWFRGQRWSRQRSVLGAGLGVIVLVTGLVGLVTLASSAALRFQPSTQFLQLLSALDIAWAAATVMVALYWLLGRFAALVGGVAVGVLCVATIARYLDAVGFTAAGRWRLDAAGLWKYVLPYDMAVAVVAIALFVVAVRRRASE